MADGIGAPLSVGLAFGAGLLLGEAYEEAGPWLTVVGVAALGAVVVAAGGAAAPWYATAGVDPQNLEPALEVVRAEVQRLREAPPPAPEVELRIGQFAGQQILAAESNAARAARLAAQEVLGIESREELVEGVRRVTPEAIWDAARTYLDPQRAVLAIVRPAQA